jgi:hypothetical protein
MIRTSSSGVGSVCMRRTEQVSFPARSAGLARLLSGVLLTLALASLSAAANGRTFEKERLALIESIHGVLIANRLCSDRNDCTRKQYAFAAPTLSGLSVSVYGVNDAAVLSEVTKQCALTLLNRPEMKKLELTLYSISKAEHLATTILGRSQYKSVRFEN